MNVKKEKRTVQIWADGGGHGKRIKQKKNCE